jgi:1,4-dihydroxy-2-naphthoate octaprenyltransferase
VYVACIVGALVSVCVVGVMEPLALIALVAAPLALHPVALVLERSDPPSLVTALVETARFQLVLSAMLAGGLAGS